MTESNRSVVQEESYDKANWEREQVDVFCSLCIKFIEAGHLKNTHMSKDGSNLMMMEFPKLTGKKYSRKQIKNKWDSLKIEWKLWKQLKGKNTGLGWDPKKKTIDASYDWWNERVEVNHKLAKFRKNGIDPEFESTLDKMFMRTVATGDFSWAPSCGHIPIESVNEEVSQPIGADSCSDFDDVSVSIPNNKTNQGSGSQVSRPKKMKEGNAHKMASCLKRLVGTVESISARNITSVSNESGVPTIATVMG